MADTIKILLVDDIAEVRENVKKLLAFEQDFEVTGSTGSGRDGIKLAKELKPDIIIMDINMPDIDGISATKDIKNALPATGVIMMSVNSDRDYLRRAMMAGASDFLTKPANMDDLYNTIRSVYTALKPMRDQIERINDPEFISQLAGDKEEDKGSGNRAGHVVVCFSPKGGVGTTTIATNLAAGLMRQDTKVLLVDADIQFGDVGVFLNLQAQSTIGDLIADVNDLDVELFDNIVVTHDSGLKVLLGPPKPEYAEPIYEVPSSVADIISQIRSHYDFVIVDTASRLDDLTIALCDIATQILLISTPTLPSIRGVRFVMDLFDQLYAEQNKVRLILTQVHEERRGQRITIPQESITKHLKREIYVSIPSEEKPLLQSIIKGTPIITAERDTSKSPVKELLQVSERVRTELLGVSIDMDDEEQEKSGGFPWLRR